jgi:hypothetical protein
VEAIMNKTVAVGIVMVLVAAAAASEAGAQQHKLDSLFIAHRKPMTFGVTAMSGPGWEMLLADAARAQFVMVGESHFLSDPPLFTARLFDALHARAGFNYLALENGPFVMKQLSATGVRGNMEASLELANRYVSALQFRNDQELEMIVAAGGRSTARTAPLWGLDQEWGALHVFERLAELARGPETKEMLDPLIQEAASLEMHRPDDTHPRYITRHLTASALEELRLAFSGVQEAQVLLDWLQTSFEIYAMRTDRPRVYASNHRREQYMRSRFMEEYHAAVAAGDTFPRVVLKFGQWHAMRGVLNWGDVEPLGTFLSEFARANGSQALFIWTGLVNEPGDVWTLHDTPEYVPIAKAGTTDSWWIVDVRPIRALVAAGQVADINDEMRKVIFGFDYALLIGSGKRATMQKVRESNAVNSN